MNNLDANITSTDSLHAFKYLKNRLSTSIALKQILFCSPHLDKKQLQQSAHNDLDCNYLRQSPEICPDPELDDMLI